MDIKLFSDMIDASGQVAGALKAGRGSRQASAGSEGFQGCAPQRKQQLIRDESELYSIV